MPTVLPWAILLPPRYGSGFRGSSSADLGAHSSLLKVDLREHPDREDNFEIVVIGIVAVFLLPMLAEIVRVKSAH